MTDEQDFFQVPETEMVKPTQQAADVKKKLVRLDGLAITEEGKLTKTKLFNFLKIDIEDYSDLALTDEQAQLVSRHLRYMTTGLNAVVPIYCGGKDKCPFKRMCPLVKVDKIPLGRICVSADTRIQLADGATATIEEIEPGALTFSCDTTSHCLQMDQVIAVVQNGSRQVYEVSTLHGHMVRCTDDHLFWAITEKVHRRSAPRFPGHSKDIASLPHRWLSIKDGLKPGDKIAVAAFLPAFGKQALPDGLPELLGYFLADGHSTKYQAWFYNTNKQYIDEFCDCCQRLGVEPRVRYRPVHSQGGMQKKECWGVLITNGRGEFNPFKKFLADSDLWDVNGPQKCVPEVIFTAPREQIRLFLNRLWSADGCVSVVKRTNRNTKRVDIVIEQENEQFIKQLQSLFLRFGVHGSLTKRVRKQGGFTYKFRVCGRKSIINFLEQIGPIFGKEKACEDALAVAYSLNNRYDHQEGDIFWDYVKEIRPIGEERVYDLQMESNSNFFANGILVHNCPIEASLVKLWTEAYIKEFDVDPADFSELSLVQELAELDIYDRRATFLLQEGEGQVLMQQQAVGVDQEGSPVYQTQIHQAWEVKERIKNRKLKVLEALVGTRQQKYKRDAALKQRSTSDPSSEMAALKQKLEQMKQHAEQHVEDNRHRLIDED